MITSSLNELQIQYWLMLIQSYHHIHESKPGFLNYLVLPYYRFISLYLTYHISILFVGNGSARNVIKTFIIHYILRRV